MAFSYPSRTAFVNRYNALHEPLRDAVDSAQGKKILEHIAREHYLDQDKQQELGALVAFVLMGFLARSELTHEIGERLFLNHQHAKALADDVSARILDSVREEIDEAYNPYDASGEPEEIEATPEEETAEEGPVAGPVSVVAKEDEGAKIRVEAPIEEAIAPISLPVSSGAEGPVVLQQGAGSFFDKRAEGPKEKRSFVPFSMFASSAETAEARPTVKVKVETPQTFAWPFEKKKKPEEKVVHYNEAHSSTSAFPETPAGLINLDAFQKSAAPGATTPITPAPTPAPISPKPGEGGPASTPETPEAEKKEWSVKTMFTKAPVPETKVAVDSAAPADTAQPVSIPVSIGATPNSPRSSEGESTPLPTEAAPAQGPALEGNVVHLK